MASAWLDFTAIKRQVPIRDVLAHYGFLEGLKEARPGKLVGPCPIHHGTGKASFHVDCGKSIWNCFSACNGGGNILDLVIKVEGCSIREAGEKLAEWFNLKFDRDTKRENSAKVSGKMDADSVPAAAHTERRVDVINPPLERPLRNLDGKHPYLKERGLTPATITHFGIGHCTRGLMQGRIAIPIHNEEGELVAYCGRAVAEERSKEEGKYKLPRGFSKSHVVFDLNRAKGHAGRGLIVVEGFFGCFKVHQAGFPNVVALMGSTLTEQQEALLKGATDRLKLMFDGDEAGAACLREFYSRLRRTMYLREVYLEAGEQPDSISVDRLRALLG
jgi:DNA primase